VWRSCLVWRGHSCPRALASSLRISGCSCVAKQNIAVAESASLGEAQVQLVPDAFKQCATAANSDGIHDNFKLIDKADRCELRDDRAAAQDAMRLPGCSFNLRTSEAVSPCRKLVLFQQLWLSVREKTNFGRLFMRSAIAGSPLRAAGVGQ